MSKLKRKHELENKIEQFITDINKEISTLESEFTFISEEDGEIKSRVFYDVIQPQEVFTRNKNNYLAVEKMNTVTLKFYDSFSLEGEELDRFLAYIDNIKEELKILRSK